MEKFWQEVVFRLETSGLTFYLERSEDRIWAAVVNLSPNAIVAIGLDENDESHQGMVLDLAYGQSERVLCYDISELRNVISALALLA